MLQGLSLALIGEPEKPLVAGLRGWEEFPWVIWASVCLKQRGPRLDLGLQLHLPPGWRRAPAGPSSAEGCGSSGTGAFHTEGKRQSQTLTPRRL